MPISFVFIALSIRPDWRYLREEMRRCRPPSRHGRNWSRVCIWGIRISSCSSGDRDSFTSRPRVGPLGAKGYPDEYSVTFAPDQVVVPGYHKKNEIGFQKDIDRFVKYVLGTDHVYRTIDVQSSTVLSRYELSIRLMHPGA